MKKLLSTALLVLCSALFMSTGSLAVEDPEPITDPGFFGYPLQYQRTMDFDHPYPSGSGLYINRITEGSRAEDAGVEEGQILRSVQGEPVNTVDDVLDLINEHRQDTVVLTLMEIAPQFRQKMRSNPFYEVGNQDIYREISYRISYRPKSPDPIPVYPGEDDRLYHRQGFDHSPSPDEARRFENPEEAARAGLKSCPICFPGGEGGLVQQVLQEQIGQSTEFVENLKEKYETVKDVPDSIRTVSVRLFRQRLRQEISPSLLLIDTDKFHGFGLRNGSILLSRGLVDLMEGTDERAAQLAHLMAHMDLRHDATPVQKARFQSLIERAIDRTTGVSITFEDIKEFSPSIPGFRFYSELIEQGYGETQERQSMFFAMVYMYQAGFDMDGVIEILQKYRDMQSRVHSRWLEYVLKHPVQSDLNELMQEWKQRIPENFDRNRAP